MGLSAWNVGVLVAIGSLWLASGTQREKPVLDAAADTHRDAGVRGLEVQVSMNPADAVRRRELAQAYLDAKAPGLAIRVVESAPASARANPALEHVYARALIDQGRSADALAAEQRVLATCAADGSNVDANANGSRCDTWLLASATRRSEILRELVDLGVDDAQAHPEASAVAYHNATREAKLAIQ